MSALAQATDLFPDIDNIPYFRQREHFADIQDDLFWSVFEKFKPFTLVGAKRFYDVYYHVRRIAYAGIPGDFIECGVFLGGLMAGAAEFANHLGISNRTFYLFDSFTGFPSAVPAEKDYLGNIVMQTWAPENFKGAVERTLALSKSGNNSFRLIEGYVEDTLKNPPVAQIAMLRLDTDYYESTRVELEVLYPRLSVGGALIVDDYGHFDGVRRATDEFLAKQESQCVLHRVDYTGRSGIKIA
jgi:O-methyltransferase